MGGNAAVAPPLGGVTCVPVMALGVLFFLVTGPTQGASGGVWVSSSAEVDPLVTDKARAVHWQVVGPNGRGALPEEFMVDNGCHQINGGVVK